MKVEVLLKSGLLCLLLILSVNTKKTNSDGKVVIGIVTLPSFFPQFPYQQYSSIVKAYVQHIQQNNDAIAVPIHWDSTEDELDDILSKVNGVLLTGGPVQFMEDNSIEQKYLETVTYIVEQAKDFTDDDDYFPVWGTCLGMQVLSYIASDNDLDIMERKMGDEGNHGLHDIDTDSRLFRGMSKEMLDWFRKSSPAYFTHDDGVIYERAQDNSDISDDVTLTSKSTSTKGVEFVASMEYDDYPIYAVQFHPEKNLFEPKAQTQRDPLSLKISRYFMEFFISECQKNDHCFEDRDELQNMRIDNKDAITINSNHHSSLYFFENRGNEDVDYDDRYGLRHFIQKKQKKHHKKQKVISE